MLNTESNSILDYFVNSAENEINRQLSGKDLLMKHINCVNKNNCYDTQINSEKFQEI